MDRYTYGNQQVGQLQSATFAIPAQDQPRDHALEQHERNLSALVSHLENLTQRVGQVIDRVLGPAPQSLSSAGEKGMANPPALRRLEDLLSIGHARLGALDDYVTRLERL